MKDKENHCVANFAYFVSNWINKLLILTKILYFTSKLYQQSNQLVGRRGPDLKT